KRMATGEVPGYDVRPAEAAILQALRSDELANPAIEAAGRLPGRNAQRELAAVVLDNARRPELRTKAAEELTRHIQQYGLVLMPDQTKALQDLFAATTDAKLKGSVALVIGAMRPDRRQSGERLRTYTPTVPAPAPPPKER